MLGLDKMKIYKRKTIDQKYRVNEKYVPLKHRTRTLDDIQKCDDSETRAKVEPMIKHYEQHREKIKSNRQKNKK